jgi:hypothetical protein
MLALVGVGTLAARAIGRDLERARDLHATEHVPSGECRRCHPAHHESWARTFHRTMTQEAHEGSVLGDFEGASFAYGGITAHFDRSDDGGFEMRFVGPDGELSRAHVERTVGSRRIQQYLAREGDVYFRLPVAWNIEEGRWMHMNGAFLTPDPVRPEGAARIELVDYHRHVTRWNDNCVFCHNVAPDPGFDPERERWETSVAELGIACGACHGPADEHVRVNRDPLRRYALHLGQGHDPTIVNPARLPPERSAEVCGRCHGQRITDDVGRFLREGDPFVPGDRLEAYSRPLARDTPLEGEEGAFAARFWPDGTARLTAYEYQGLLQSACVRGGMTCTTCHGMHEGDPRGQLRPAAVGDGACTSCHEELASEASARAHARHDQVQCVDCHMPRVVYGLVGVHRSHRIELPDPGRQAADGRPDACTLCHVDRPLGWATRGHAELFGAALASDDDEPHPHVDELALGGDPIERAVALAALGRADVPVSADERARRLGLLLTAMEHDDYPALRRIAWRSARALAPAHVDARYEPTGDRDARAAWVERVRAATPVLAPDASRVSALRARAGRAAIEIGE